ncbi:DUF5658 family protein [Paenisporosarcina sp. TG20]|uniref:DUF5658 family protein n=1 Tax=Paenisporosarcina sp. TG20 TaxID=1211706 RepID=UPI00036C317D|nr:DUF5658 family protein [Paenisporosarcina sp. TG20]
MVLNTLDGVFTYIGLKNLQMVEANPFLRTLKPESVLVLKLLLSGLLSYVIFNKGLIRFGKKFQILLSMVIAVYSGVILLHLFWLIPFLF